MAIQKVIVTGSDGLVGRAVVQDLRDYGYRVTCADKFTTRKWGTKIVDCEDLGQVVSVMREHDAVVHLAAIPNPIRNPAEVVFRNNAVSTYNILEAAAILGIKKVVLASSISALGTPFMVRPITPLCVPIDEEHPLLSQDAYGLSKMVGEVLAEGFSRRITDMSLASLRLSTVINDDVRADYISTHVQRLDLDDAMAGVFWTYIDVRDAASSFRMALEANLSGHEAFYIAAPQTLSGSLVEELLARYYPGDYPVAAHIHGSASPVDCGKAERMLGWRAVYHWEGGKL